MTDEEIRDYHKRLNQYRVSRDFFANLFREGWITETEFEYLNQYLLIKYHIEVKIVYSMKIQNRLNNIEKTGIVVVTNFFESLKSGIIGLTQRQLKKSRFP